MKLPRRKILHLAKAGAFAILPVWPRLTAAAADYPARPVRVLVGYGPGGAPDILARLIRQWPSGRFAQQFVIENKPGAGGGLATEAAVNASQDGYTLLLVLLTDAVSASLLSKPQIQFCPRPRAPVAGLTLRDPDVMVVNPAFPAKTAAEFIGYAEFNPGKINMGSPGVGTSPHMAGELFKFMAGLHMTHVAYRSSGPGDNRSA